MNNNPLNEINLLNIIINSDLLKKILPEVRIRALINTIYECNNESDSKTIILENLCESPYIQENEKNIILDLFFNDKFIELYEILQCKKKNADINNDLIFNFNSFRRMVLSIKHVNLKRM